MADSVHFVRAAATTTHTHHPPERPPDALRSHNPSEPLAAQQRPSTPVSEETDGEAPPAKRDETDNVGQPSPGIGARDPGPATEQPDPNSPQPSAPGPPVIVVLASTKGGVGKTTVLIALASDWATRFPNDEIIVFDIDRQDRGGATAWLDASDDQLPNLRWTTGTADDLAATEFPPGTIVFVDTPPSTENMTAVMTAARLADLVLIPGTIDEIDITTQTARALDALAVGVPYAAVINRSLSVTVASQEGSEAFAELAEADVDLAAIEDEDTGIKALTIRATRALAIARKEGRLPIDVIGAMGDPVRGDISGLTDWVAQRTGVSHAED